MVMRGSLVGLLLALAAVLSLADGYDYEDDDEGTTIEPWLRRTTVEPWAWDFNRQSGLLKQTPRTWMRGVAPGTRLADAMPSQQPYTWLPPHKGAFLGKYADSQVATDHANYNDATSEMSLSEVVSDASSERAKTIKKATKKTRKSQKQLKNKLANKTDTGKRETNVKSVTSIPMESNKKRLTLLTEEHPKTPTRRKMKNTTDKSLKGKRVSRVTTIKALVEQVAAAATKSVRVSTTKNKDSVDKKSKIDKKPKSKLASRIRASETDTESTSVEAVQVLEPDVIITRKTRRKSKAKSAVDSKLTPDISVAESTSQIPKRRLQPRILKQTDKIINSGSEVSTTQTELNIGDVKKRKTKLKTKLTKSTAKTITNEKDIQKETSFTTESTLDNDRKAYMEQDAIISKLARDGKIAVGGKIAKWPPKETISRRSKLSDQPIKPPAKADKERGRGMKGEDKLGDTAEWDDGLARVASWDGKPARSLSKTSPRRTAKKEESAYEKDSSSLDRSRKRDSSTQSRSKSGTQYQSTVKKKKSDPDIAFKAYNERMDRRQSRNRNDDEPNYKDSKRGYQPRNYGAGERSYRGRGEDGAKREDDRRGAYEPRSRYREDGAGERSYRRRGEKGPKREDDRRGAYEPRSRYREDGAGERSYRRRGEEGPKREDDRRGAYEPRSRYREDTYDAGAGRGEARRYDRKDNYPERRDDRMSRRGPYRPSSRTENRGYGSSYPQRASAPARGRDRKQSRVREGSARRLKPAKKRDEKWAKRKAKKAKKKVVKRAKMDAKMKKKAGRLAKERARG